MKKVYKYPLVIANSQTVKLPLDAEILSVQAQGDMVCLWAMVDPAAPPVARYIAIHGTGHECYEGNLTHISTFQMHGGALVFHAFEYTPAPDTGSKHE